MPSPGSTVLVLTHWFDPTADMVIEELNRRHVPVYRVDPGDLPDRLEVTGELAVPGFATTLRLPERTLSLPDVLCAWYRRPTAFRFPPDLGAADRRWATGEARAAVGGLVQLLPRWLNHPAAIGRAEYKPIQLDLARKIGLDVPATLITNEPRRAERFAIEFGGTVMSKSLAPPLLSGDDGESSILYTTPVTAEQAGDLGVRLTPHLFQQRIPKDHELRITCIDGRCHTARIETHSARAAEDWRADRAHVSYRAAALPDDVQRSVLRLVSGLGLRYAAVDMVVDPDGRHWFLEVNPNGQFGFVEHATGMPLSAAIARALTVPAKEWE